MPCSYVREARAAAHRVGREDEPGVARNRGSPADWAAWLCRQEFHAGPTDRFRLSFLHATVVLGVALFMAPISLQRDLLSFAFLSLL